jgi:hypothetical protein
MNAPLFLLVAWFAVGVLFAIFSLWYMKTHEKQMVDEDPEYQIFGCIPPPIKWSVVILMLLFGPVVLLRAIYEAIQESRKEKDENDISGRTPAAVPATDIDPQVGFMLFYGLIGAALTAWFWANACTAQPAAAYFCDQAKFVGFFLFVLVLGGALAKGSPFKALREQLYFAPLYLVNQIPSVVAMTVGWEGGWILGVAGAGAGAATGAASGWLFNRWTLPEIENRPSVRRRAILLPIAFAVLFAIYGAHNWASVWLTTGYAWAIGLFPLVFAFLGGLVGRPFLGMLTALPVVPLQLVPLVASMTVGWEGGWIPGIAGAAVGAAAGAVNGWLYDRWVMPEYDKRRERERAVRSPGSTDGPGSSGSMAERS